MNFAILTPMCCGYIILWSAWGSKYVLDLCVLYFAVISNCFVPILVNIFCILLYNVYFYSNNAWVLYFLVLHLWYSASFGLLAMISTTKILLSFSFLYFFPKPWFSFLNVLPISTFSFRKVHFLVCILNLLLHFSVCFLFEVTDYFYTLTIELFVQHVNHFINLMFSNWGVIIIRVCNNS